VGVSDSVSRLRLSEEEEAGRGGGGNGLIGAVAEVCFCYDSEVWRKLEMDLA
jgi:hypothetical protein